MEAAMGSKRFKAFKDLMEVLEATGRVPKAQSMTEPAMQAAKAETREAAPVASTVLKPLNLRDWWLDMKSGDWREAMAKVITSPDGIKELEKLRKLKSTSSNTEKAIEIVSTALLKSGVYSFSNFAGYNTGAMTNVLKDQNIR